MSVTIVSAVVCDDVRREINGKDIIIGAYASEIIFNKLPASSGLCMWLEVTCPEPAAILSVRISFNGEIGAIIKIDAEFKTSDSVAIVTPNLQMTFGQSGDLVFEISENEADWKEIKRKHVRVGDVKTITTLKDASELKAPSS